MIPTDQKEERFAFTVDGVTKKGHDNRYEDLPDDMLCGIGPFKSHCLQTCARMGCFVCACSAYGLVTSFLNVYIASQITTIEKQYGLSSSQSGFLLSCNDIGFLFATLFASYFARKLHIPRILWLSAAIYGVAGIVCSLPFFISKNFMLEQSAQLSKMMSSESTGSNSSVVSFTMYRKSPMCNTDKYVSAEAGNEVIMLNTTICDMQESETSFGVGEPNKYTNVAMTVIAIGMIIQGLAKAPRLPFGTIYIDDNVKQQKTAMYMGIIYGVSIFGPAIAFAIGGYFSKQYVTLEDVPISPRHPAWIGAWWLGFIVVGTLAIFVSLPLVCFPRRMRPRLLELKPLKPDSLKQSILDFFKSILRLICNSVYMPLVASICILQFAVAGMVSFGAKYLETQFFIPAWKANVLTGVMRISAASAGTVVGGLIVTKKKLSPLACVKMLLLLGCLAEFQIALEYVFGCSNEDITGFNVKSNSITETNMTCSDMCGCDSSTYFPMCGSDNRNYMSPCHAGCQQQDKMMFKDCACVGQNATAIPGLCETSCVMLYPYLVNIIVGAFLQTLGIMPAFIVMLRSVSETDKSMAVGFSALLSTLCGWFAGPIAFGRIIDTACVIWSASCSGKGACSLYDNNDFRIKMSTLQVVAKVMVVSLQVVVFFRARIKTDWTVNKPDSSNTVEELDVVKSMITEEESELTTFTDDWKPKRVSKGEKSNSR